jgi:hypothetical protein
MATLKGILEEWKDIYYDKKFGKVSVFSPRQARANIEGMKLSLNFFIPGHVLIFIFFTQCIVYRYLLQRKSLFDCATTTL